MSTPLLSITLTPVEVVILPNGTLAVNEIEDEARCRHCNGTNLDVREDEDRDTGYRSSELYCNDCRGSAE